MKGKLMLAAGLAVGYVLGTRAGRQEYDRMVAGAKKLWRRPETQQAVSEVGDAVAGAADRVTDRIAERVTGRTGDEPDGAPEEAGDERGRAAAAARVAAAGARARQSESPEEASRP